MNSFSLRFELPHSFAILDVQIPGLLAILFLRLPDTISIKPFANLMLDEAVYAGRRVPVWKRIFFKIAKIKHLSRADVEDRRGLLSGEIHHYSVLLWYSLSSRRLHEVQIP